MIPPGTQAVFFDAVGTVLHPVGGAPTIYAEAAKRFGLAADAKVILERFRAAYLREEAVDKQCDWVTSEARERQRWQEIVRHTLPNSPPVCFEFLYDHFAKPEAWSVTDDAAALFTHLRKRGLRLGLASNYDERLVQVAAGRPELWPLRQHILISSQLGVRKPGAAFFERVVRAAACPPEAIAFVGDDLDNDYHGAEAAGMTAILFDPQNRYPEVPRRINRFGELISK